MQFAHVFEQICVARTSVSDRRHAGGGCWVVDVDGGCIKLDAAKAADE